MSMVECKNQYGRLGMCSPGKGLEGCYLFRELDAQNIKGGSRNPQFDKSGNGPYWRKKSWDSYMSRLESEAKKGCACAQALFNEIQLKTKEKKQNGELIA